MRQHFLASRPVRLACVAALALALTASVAGGCARNPAPVDPAAQARLEQREQTRREALSLQQRQRQALAKAASDRHRAQQLRAAAAPLASDGTLNVQAGEAMCEAGDCAIGCAVALRGEAKLERSRLMHARADELDARAGDMRADAGRLGHSAQTLLATLPRD